MTELSITTEVTYPDGTKQVTTTTMVHPIVPNSTLRAINQPIDIPPRKSENKSSQPTFGGYTFTGTCGNPGSVHYGKSGSQAANDILLSPDWDLKRLLNWVSIHSHGVTLDAPTKRIKNKRDYKRDYKCKLCGKLGHNKLTCEHAQV